MVDAQRGYRPVQIWVPDIRSETFSTEAHRQATMVAQQDRHIDDRDFIESLSIPWDED